MTVAGRVALFVACVACSKSPSATPAADSATSAPVPAASTTAVGLARVARSSLTVTHGALAGAASGPVLVRSPEVRAVAVGSGPDAAELHFTYRGPSQETARLGSGELRRQIGLKLRAESGCNLVYVMWRIEPKEELVVSVKENPGQRTHAECGTRGYRNVTGSAVARLPKLVVGEPHTLGARVDGEQLTVTVDGAAAGTYALGAGVTRFTGAVGFRTDNGDFDVELFAAAGAAGGATSVEDD